MTVENDASYVPLSRWLKTATGLTSIIPAFGGGDEPTGTHGVLTLLNDGPEGGEESRTLTEVSKDGEDVVVEAPHRPWMWTWQFDVYGTGGRDMLNRIDLAMRVPSVHAALKPYRVHNLSAVRNLTEVSDNAFEERANITITLHANRTDGLVVDVAETASLVFQAAS